MERFLQITYSSPRIRVVLKRSIEYDYVLFIPAPPNSKEAKGKEGNNWLKSWSEGRIIFDGETWGSAFSSLLSSGCFLLSCFIGYLISLSSFLVSCCFPGRRREYGFKLVGLCSHATD